MRLSDSLDVDLVRRAGVGLVLRVEWCLERKALEVPVSVGQLEELMNKARAEDSPRVVRPSFSLDNIIPLSVPQSMSKHKRWSAT